MGRRRFPWVLVALGIACGGKSVSIGSDGSSDDGVGAAPAGGVAGTGGSFGGKGGASTGGVPRGGTGASSNGGTGASSNGGSAIGGSGAAFPGRGGGNTAGSASLDPPGPVYCGGVECPAPRACCLATSVCFDPATEPDLCPRPPLGRDDTRPCASNAHCSFGETCVLPPLSLCQGNGHCVAIASCPGSGYAICGCDGNSYPNVETACRSGANPSYFSYLGGGAGCGTTVDANAGEGSPRVVTLCGNDAHCRNGERCCALTGACYPESDPGRCQIPPDGTRNPCTADDQCFAGLEFCAGEGCSGPGGCVQMDAQAEDCGARLEPVCGCNGVTYTSVACAYADGVRVASQGTCPVDE
jgi:hypothetical protein